MAATLDGANRPGPPVLRGWFHVVGLAGILGAGPLLVSRGRDPRQQAVLALYVLTIVALFGVSSAFHRVNWSVAARRRVRRADHVTIFLAIAGTYTAIASLALHGWARNVLLAVVWLGAAGGIALRQLWLDAPKWAVAVPYVVVGWSALTVVPQLLDALGATGFALLVLGGVAYTAGALVYARRRPDPVPSVFGFHEIFHLCTIVGATLHFVVVARFALR